MLHAVLGLALCLPVESGEPVELRSGRPIEIQLDAEHPARLLSYRVLHDGHVSVHAVCAQADLALQLLDDAGDLIREDDDGGGGTTPYLELETRPGQVLRFRCRAREILSAVTVRVSLFESAETDATRGLAARIEEQVAITAWRIAESAGDTGAALDDLMETLGQADDPDLLSRAIVRSSYAAGGLLFQLGEWSRLERVATPLVDHLERSRAADDPGLVAMLEILGLARFNQGHPESAAPLFRRVLDSRLRTLGAEHPSTAVARSQVAATEFGLGNLESALAEQVEVVSFFERHRSPTDPDRLTAQSVLARILSDLGRYERAIDLDREVLAAREASLGPDDHLTLESCLNLASSLRSFHDLLQARQLLERVLEARQRTLEESDQRLSVARASLGSLLHQLGEFDSARDLLEVALFGLEAIHGPGHPVVEKVRMTLGISLLALDDAEQAGSLLQKSLANLEEQGHHDHPDAVLARKNLALACRALGRSEEARELLEEVLSDAPRDLPALVDLIDLLVANEAGSDDQRVVDLIRRLALVLNKNLDAAEEVLSPRQAEEMAAGHARALSLVVAMNALQPALDQPALFELVESHRAVGLTQARRLRVAAAAADIDPAVGLLRREIIASSRELGRISRRGGDLLPAIQARETAQRALRDHLGSNDRFAASLPRFDAASVAETLRETECAIALWRTEPHSFAAIGSGDTAEEERYLAFIVQPDASVQRVELGAASLIEAAVQGYRTISTTALARGIAARTATDREEAPHEEARKELRRLLFEPLLRHLEDKDTWIIALTDALNLVPVDAVLAEEPIRIVIRSTLGDPGLRRPPLTGHPTLLAMGDANYDSRGQGAGAGRGAGGSGHRGMSCRVLRAARPSFERLPGAGQEAHAVVQAFQQLGAQAEALLLEDDLASRDLFEQLAPRHRFIHLATHGYFAPEDLRRPPTRVGTQPGATLTARGSGSTTGFAPGLLAGLAFAGANQHDEEQDGYQGIMTAEEIAALDLSACELATLSACSTGVGALRRAGQGIASVRQAFEAAGCRATLTSLWEVEDQATRRFMEHFYRLLWVDGLGKADALRKTKAWMQAARGQDGRPLHSPSHWAGWVLVGESD